MKLFASVESDRGKVATTRGGNREIDAHLRGCEEGARVSLRLNADGKIIVSVYRTGGKNDGRSQVLIAEWVEGNAEVYIGCGLRKLSEIE